MELCRSSPITPSPRCSPRFAIVITGAVSSRFEGRRMHERSQPLQVWSKLDNHVLHRVFPGFYGLQRTCRM